MNEQFSSNLISTEFLFSIFLRIASFLPHFYCIFEKNRCDSLPEGGRGVSRGTKPIIVLFSPLLLNVERACPPIVLPDGNAAETNANQEVVQYKYNAAGDVMQLIDGKNQSTKWGYDQLCLLSSTDRIF